MRQLGYDSWVCPCLSGRGFALTCFDWSDAPMCCPFAGGRACSPNAAHLAAVREVAKRRGNPTNCIPTHGHIGQLWSINGNYCYYTMQTMHCCIMVKSSSCCPTWVLLIIDCCWDIRFYNSCSSQSFATRTINKRTCSTGAVKYIQTFDTQSRASQVDEKRSSQATSVYMRLAELMASHRHEFQEEQWHSDIVC